MLNILDQFFANFKTVKSQIYYAFPTNVFILSAICQSMERKSACSFYSWILSDMFRNDVEVQTAFLASFPTELRNITNNQCWQRYNNFSRESDLHVGRLRKMWKGFIGVLDGNI